jgi:hypothetical protein
MMMMITITIMITVTAAIMMVVGGDDIWRHRGDDGLTNTTITVSSRP